MRTMTARNTRRKSVTFFKPAFRSVVVVVVKSRYLFLLLSGPSLAADYAALSNSRCSKACNDHFQPGGPRKITWTWIMSQYLFILGLKIRYSAGWKNIDPFQQWKAAPEDSNVGLRCGGTRRLCVLDSDDKKRPTWRNMSNFLCGLGLENYPTIATPHSGRQVYLELLGSLPGNYQFNRNSARVNSAMVRAHLSRPRRLKS